MDLLSMKRIVQTTSQWDIECLEFVNPVCAFALCSFARTSSSSIFFIILIFPRSSCNKVTLHIVTSRECMKYDLSADCAWVFFLKNTCPPTIKMLPKTWQLWRMRVLKQYKCAVFYPNCVHITEFLCVSPTTYFMLRFQHVFVVSIMDTINDVLMNV